MKKNENMFEFDKIDCITLKKWTHFGTKKTKKEIFLLGFTPWLKFKVFVLSNRRKRKKCIGNEFHEQPR